MGATGSWGAEKGLRGHNSQPDAPSCRRKEAEAGGSLGKWLLALLPGGITRKQKQAPQKVCGIWEQRGREPVRWDKLWKDSRTLETHKRLVATVPAAWPKGDAETIIVE